MEHFTLDGKHANSINSAITKRCKLKMDVIIFLKNALCYNKNHVCVMWKFLGGGGVIKDPLGTEIPKGWGVQTKKPSVGGVWIFSGTTHWLSRCDLSDHVLI